MSSTAAGAQASMAAADEQLAGVVKKRSAARERWAAQVLDQYCHNSDARGKRLRVETPLPLLSVSDQQSCAQAAQSPES